VVRRRTASQNVSNVQTRKYKSEYGAAVDIINWNIQRTRSENGLTVTLFKPDHI
jgi:hypothetical protein